MYFICNGQNKSIFKTQILKFLLVKINVKIGKMFCVQCLQHTKIKKNLEMYTIEMFTYNTLKIVNDNDNIKCKNVYNTCIINFN